MRGAKGITINMDIETGSTGACTSMNLGKARLRAIWCNVGRQAK